jgi:hypothetical protein
VLTLRKGTTPTNLTDTTVTCNGVVNTQTSCTNLPFSVPAGSFLDFGYNKVAANTSGVFTAVTCE